MSIVTSIVGPNGEVAFRVFSHEVQDVSLHRVIDDPARAAGFFRSVREDAVANAIHVVWSASTGAFTLPQIHLPEANLEPWSPNMDLLTAFHTANAIDESKKGPRDVVYVAPLPPSGVPEDGALVYSTVEELRDLFGDVAPNHCFLFTESANSLAVLKVVNDNPNIVPFNAVRLEGLTAVEYTAAFMRDSWALESAQYYTVVSEKAERVQAAHNERREVAAKSTFHREKQARTKLTGGQRRHTAFDVVNPDLAVDADLDIGASES